MDALVPPPRPVAERRARQAEVERLLIQGVRSGVAFAALAEKYGVSLKTLRSDTRRLDRRWHRDRVRDGGAAWSTRVLRRLDALAVRQEEAGDLRGATEANAALAQALGLGVAPTVAVSAQSATVSQAPETERDAKFAGFLRGAALVNREAVASLVSGKADERALEFATRGLDPAGKFNVLRSLAMRAHEEAEKK